MLRRIKRKKAKEKICWCGSGKKFIQCHGNIAHQEKVKISDVVKDFNESFTKEDCYAPEAYHHECSSEIIAAHTVSKSTNLKLIAKDNHVYCFSLSLGKIIKKEGGIEPEKKSIKKTSIFYGFCSHHDTKLFLPLDQGMQLTPEHIFLNQYRVISRELYLKEKIGHFQSTKMKSYDKGKTPDEQLQHQIATDLISTGTEAAYKDLHKIKTTMDTMLINSDYDQIKYYALVIDTPPEIMSAGVWNATNDFDNTQLIDLNDLEMNYNSLSVSTLFYDNKGLILFSWIEGIFDCPECYKFIQSLNSLSREEQINAVTYWLFASNENIYFSPEWWESLSPDQKQQLINIFRETIESMPNYAKYKTMISVVDWTIEKVETNIDL